MLDIRYIREHAEEVQLKSQQKGYKVDTKALLSLDSSRRELSSKIELLRQKRNEHAAGLKQGKPTEEQLSEGRDLKAELTKLEEEFTGVDKQFLELLKKVPNMPLADVPVGASEDENIITKTVGEPPKFDFDVKNHNELGVAKGWIDKERAAKVSGSRFAYVKGDLVRLQRAVVDWAIDVMTDEEVIKNIVKENDLKVSTKPFVPVMPPALIKTDVYSATGRLNAEETTYKLEDDDLWLNASAEHSMCPMYMNEILPEAELPIRYVAYSTSFRREAGTYGKDMEGIFRLHQFDKLEAESFTTAADGLQEHKLMVAIQEYLMQQLKLPYRVVQKCTYDIGGPNATGIDIDCWLPGQDKYRETHTADYITDYQARSLQTRVRLKNGDVELVHTNDATVLSMRPLIAILENNQDKDGNITLPQVLRPYMGGRAKI